MGCACNKKVKPLGASVTTTTTTPLPQWYSPSQSFTLKSGSGTQTFGSRLEYEAARRRAGL